MQYKVTMKRIFTALLFFTFSLLYTQNVPKIILDNGTITVKKLKVNVEIIGDIAITTYDMSFYNSRNRILEGELVFPLGENQSVTRFALDINGKLREAVVVEKEKARVAFESTVRDRIDPALLEQSKGNNYKARVYPIPGKGYKRVVLAYQQKLIFNNNSYYYKIPFDFKNKLDEFTLSIDILNQKNKPILSQGLLNDFIYNPKKNSYSASIYRKRVRVRKPTLIKIPLNADRSKLIETKEYFYYAKQINVENGKIKKAKEVSIFWDSSLSQKNKKVDTEIEFLEKFFKSNKNIKVNFILFHFKNQEKTIFNIKNGDWSALKRRLVNINFDGATSYDFLNEYNDNADTHFIFTNGLNTLGNEKLQFKTTTHIVNSLTSANHDLLKSIANLSGGKYINLQQSSIKNALEKISNKPVQIIGTNITDNEIELYPKVGSVISNSISLSGKKNSRMSDIKVYLGSGNDTLSVVQFQLSNKLYSTGIVKTLWAQTKLKSLVLNPNVDEKQIIRFSKKHQLISPFTSLLVLDRIEDYVTHEIVPPKELQKKYFDLLSLKRNNKKERLANLKKNLENSYSSFKDWVNNKKKVDSIKKTVSNDSVTNNDNIESERDTVNNNLEEGEFVLSGNVRDGSGNLPGVSVLIKGTTNGTETDFDGNFSITTKRGDRLVFSYLGYVTREIQVRSNRRVRILLEEDANVLDEVVVTGLATERTRRSLRRSESKKKNSKDKINGIQINLKPWNPDTPYLKALEKITNPIEAYRKYLKLREDYGESPSFFIDVADYFKKKDEFELSKLILSNVAELDLSNYELLKSLAYKFEEYKLWEYAVFIYQEILKLRPEDIQSYRDLALAFENAGKIQKSFDLLYRIVKGEFIEKDMQRRYKGVEVIALQEMNRLIELYQDKIDYSYIEKKYIIKSKVDVRVVIDWNHNDTDIDLWVFDPTGEKCFYSNRNTKIGGKMSNDMTRGFGPEQYILKNAIKGTYKIDVNYYGDSKQKISGPTFLKVTTFINYGKLNEQRKVQLVRLASNDDELDLGSIEIK